jgi:hypothetical protein
MLRLRIDAKSHRVVAVLRLAWDALANTDIAAGKLIADGDKIKIWRCPHHAVEVRLQHFAPLDRNRRAVSNERGARWLI